MIQQIIIVLFLVISYFVQALTGFGGITLIIYAVNVLKEKESFRSTMSLIFTTMSVLMISFQLGQGVYTPKVNHFILLSLAPVIVTGIIANKVASKINTKLMLKVIYENLC